MTNSGKDFQIGVMFRREYPPELLREYARRTEAAGFDELWIVEDCFWAGGMASSAVALASTESIRVGLGIAPAVGRNPAIAAMDIALLARVFPGRFLPGFGHGVADWMRQIGAFPKSQLKALGETASAVRALLAGENVTVAGQHVQHDNVKLVFPPDKLPVISLGVRGPESLALAGRVADGTLLAEGSSPAYVRWAREQIARGQQSAGRTGQHRVTVYAWTSIDEDAQAARDALRPLLAGMIGSGSADMYLRPLGILPRVAELMADGGLPLLEREMPDRWIEQLAVTGTAQDGAAAIRALAEAGADSVVIVPPAGEPLDVLDRVAQTILPLLA